MKSFKKLARELFILILLSCGTLLSYADGIYDMEKWQAEKVLSYLQGEQFIISYCDCCKNFPMQIIEIENLNIEPSENRLYQIRVRGSIIAIFSTDNLGRANNPKPSSKYYNELVTLNYTFVAKNNKGIGLAHAVGITTDASNTQADSSSQAPQNADAFSSCQQFIDFPPASLQVFEKNSKYIDWFNKRFEKLDYDNLLIGSWKLRYFFDNFGTVTNQNMPSWRFNFKSDKTYFTNVGDGETGKWFVQNDVLITLSDENNSVQEVPFFIDANLFKIKVYNESNGFKVLVFEKQN